MGTCSKAIYAQYKKCSTFSDNDCKIEVFPVNKKERDLLFQKKDQEQKQRKGVTTSNLPTTNCPMSACMIESVLWTELILEHSDKLV